MKPVLYIIMRSDLDSLNPGKAMAQAAHAATAFERKWHSESAPASELYEEWRSSTSQGFGTKIVLDGYDMDTINDVLSEGYGKGFGESDVILDPTYPLVDGDFTHYIPLETCAYIFADADEWKPNLPLHE